ncbi:molybdopterin biosynthesis protein [Mycoplasma sp. P36-A1]|uniref:molybdopterin biosynthesis protein n=1 Tax=Mycoplasma sp. P36-A1 TaxID=3252900 RepID=UPI003C2FEE3E
MRNTYLKTVDLDNVMELYLNRIKNINVLKTEIINIKDSLNRITSKAIYAKISSPNYNASAMDGISIDAALTVDASENNPIVLKEKDYKYVDTGDVIKDNHNAVIMIEDLLKDYQNNITIIKPASYFQHIRIIGEDITQQQMIVASNHQIRAVDIGSIIASKNEYIEVYKQLNIEILPTGDEIVDVGIKKMDPGMIIDSNSIMIKSLLAEMNLNSNINPVCKDNKADLKQTLTSLSKEADIIIINAGTSAGSEDYTKEVIAELGEVIVHGIAIKPGKPAILGVINKTIIIGLPGYPVSAYIVFEQVLKPLLNKLYKQNIYQEKALVTLTQTIYSSLKHLEFVRVKIGKVNNKLIATPLSRGAGISMSLAMADGIITIPKNSEGYHNQEQVEVSLLKPLRMLEEQLIIIGSHDIILDEMQDSANIQEISFNISSNHVGSYAGLLALKNKECNIAPIHILDEDGTYNINVIKELFTEEMVLIKGVKRRQVLAYNLENNKNITGIKSLKDKSVKYVNRQKGSGTTILFEYLLKQSDIKLQEVNGYDFVMPTHFNVGAAIKNNTADTGLLIKSVADILALDYLEVMSEEYDFLIYKSDLNNLGIQNFIKVLTSDNFKEKIAIYETYDVSNTGKLIYINEVL